MDTRSISIDMLKAISIFGVVYIHSAGLMGCESDISEFCRRLFLFAVPCFIVTWAYFIEKSLLKRNKKQQFKYLKKRFYHLLFTYSLWSILYFVFYVDFHFKDLKIIDVIKTNFAGEGWPGQYFFIVLFQYIILFPLLRSVLLHKTIRNILTILSIVTYIYYAYNPMPVEINSWGYRTFIPWIPHFLLGIHLANGYTKKVSPWYLLLVLSIPLEYFFINKVFHISNASYIHPSVLISSIVISAFAIQHRTTQNKFIALIGQKTMIIFVANPLVIKILTFGLPFSIKVHQCTTITKVLLPFISATLVLIICLIFDYLIKILRLEKYLN